ncbi:MAG: cadherin domain-containing protein [Planctomycetota bacterium]
MSFNSSATNALVNSAMQQIAYANSSEAPPASVQIDWSFSDGNSGAQGTGGALTATGNVVINITAVNDAPTAVADTATAVEAGGVANGTAGTNPTGNVLTNDPDPDTGDTKTVVGVSAGVQPLGASPVSTPILGTYGSITIAADGSYTYTIDNSNAAVQSLRTSGDTLTDTFTYTMQDAAGLTSTTQITVTIQGTNDAPHDLSGTLTMAENVANGSIVETITRSDVDSGDGAAYSLVDNAGGRFAINSSTGVVTVANTTLLNFEAATSHNITVRVTDTAGATFDKVMTVTLTDVDEFDVGPVSDINPASNNINENAAVGTTVGITASASDADATTNTITYTLDDSAAGRFAVDSSTGVVTVAGSIDYETNTSHSITVRATSSDTSFSTQSFTITIGDVDEFDVTVPTDSDATLNNVNENVAIGTTVGLTANAFDIDATTNTITYSLTSNPDGLFQIDASTGVVTTAAAINREVVGASRSITVQASSSDGSSAGQTFTIAIDDLDEFDVTTPTDTDATLNNVDENVAVGITVGITANAFDLDSTTNTVTYSLTSNPDGLFQIDASTGVVTTAAAINREVVGVSRSITVQATSSDGSTASQTFTIAINDLDEFDASTVNDIDATSNRVAENVTNGTTVGITASASDADGSNNAITYSLDDSAGGRFAIDSSTGVVTVANGSLLNFESAASHTITIRATSSDTSFSTANFAIQLSDVNEAPVLSDSVLTLTVNEDAGLPSGATGALVNTFTVGISDVDGGAVRGIAITAISETVGKWYYTINGGTTWSTVGTVSSTSSLLLADDANTRLYFAPNLNYNGTATSALTFLAWDQTSGSAGTKVNTTTSGMATAFSTATDVVDVTVTSVNDAPVLTAGGTLAAVMEGSLNPPGAVIGTLATANDIADAGSIVGYAIVGNSANSTTQGVWQYSTDGGTNWSNIGSVGDGASALSVSATTRVRFVPAADFYGAPTGLTIRALDNSYASGFSVAGSAEVRVTLDTSVHGGTSSVSAAAASIGTNITPDASKTSHMVLHWRLDDTGTGAYYGQDASQRTTTSIADASGQGIGGTLINMDGTEWVDGRTGGALNLNGVVPAAYDYVVSNSTLNLVPTQYTVAFWVNADAMGEWRPIVGEDAGGITGPDWMNFLFHGAPDGSVYMGQTGYERFALAAGTLTTGTWTHFAMTFDNGVSRAYKNGAVLGTASGWAMGSTWGTFLLGGPQSWEGTDARFDDLRIYKIALSASDVVTIANPPLLGSMEGTAISYTENAPAVALTNALTLTDANNGTMTSATVAIVRNLTAGDTLSFTNQNGISGSYNPSNGVLTLSGTASAANYQAALRSVQFSSTSEDPTAGGTANTRSIAFLVNDGTLDSNPVRRDITLTVLNDAPLAFADSATAVEAGGVGNSTAGTNPAGNVLTNDTDVDTGDTKTVSGVAAGVVGSASTNVGANVTGAYGTINIAADGSYTYTVDNSNAAVQALRTPANSLTDTFTYTMRDAAGLTSTAQITITIQGANDAPQDITGTLSIAESAANGSTVGVITHSDSDSTDGASYSLLDDAGGRFTINSSTGVVTVANSSGLNYEAATSHNITVRVTDTAGATFDKVMTVSLSDADEFDVSAITDSNPSGNSVEENAAIGSTIGLTVFAADQDATQSQVTYQLLNSAGGRFAINSSTGVVTVAGPLDYEVATIHTLLVRATSQDGSTTEQSFMVSVLPLNDNVPVLVSPSTYHTGEHRRDIGMVQGTDADLPGQSLSYAISGGADAARFNLDPVSGQLQFASLQDFEMPADADADGVYEVRIRVSDGQVWSEQLVQVTVTDENDLPDAANDYWTLDEDTLIEQSVIANDGDQDSDSLVVRLLEGPVNAASFTLYPDGTFRYLPAADWFGTDSFRYQLSDGRGGTTEGVVTLQVQPVNDAPISLEKLFSVFQGSTLTTVTGVLTSDIDKDNDPLIAILVSPPTRGLISFRRDGTFVYEPEIGFIGVDRFTYVASDGVTSGQPTTVEVKVEVGSVILPAITPFSDSSSSASSLSGDSGSHATSSGGESGHSGAGDSDNTGSTGDTVAKNSTSTASDSGGSGATPLVGPLQPSGSGATKFAVGDGLTEFDREQELTERGPDSVIRLHELPADAAAIQQRLDSGFSLLDLFTAKAAGGAGNDVLTSRLEIDGRTIEINFARQQLWEQLAFLERQIAGQQNSPTDSSLYLEALEIGTATMAASLGYVFWFLRGSALMATAVTQLPTWKMIDPLVVLDSLNGEQSGEGKDGDLVNSYFEGQPNP